MQLLRNRMAANLSFLFQDMPFLDRFAAASKAGFRHVEFLFPNGFTATEVAQSLEDNGLTLALFNAPPGDWERGERGLAALTGREDEFIEGIRHSLDYAQFVGVRRIHVMAGIADRSDQRARATYHANLSRAVELAARTGVEILIEPINGTDMPGYFLQDVGEAADIVEAFERGRLGLQFDVYHCQRIHGSVLDRLEAHLPLISHMQIAGVPDRHEPSEPALPLREIFRLLDRSGYSGRVGCEYRPLAGTVEGLRWISEVEECLA